LSNVFFDDVVVLLEYVGVNQLILLSGLEVHAVLITELLLHSLEVLIEEDLLQDTHCAIELVVFHILA
jgi:hypothetical protein